MDVQSDTQEKGHERSTWPEVVILVLNWNGWRDTVECLESLQRLSYPNYRMVLIDNNSTDGSMDKIKAWAKGEYRVESKFLVSSTANKPVYWIQYDRSTAEAGGLSALEAELEEFPHNSQAVLIQTGANLGFAGGNNVGIRYAMKQASDYVWLLNNDTVAEKDALTEMVKLAKSNMRIGMVGSKLLYYRIPTTIQAAGGGKIIPWLGINKHIGAGQKDNGQWDRIFEPDYICGASMLIGLDVVSKVGLLDEGYFLYVEDMDWSERVRRSGLVLKYCPTSRIWHKEGSTIGFRSPKAEYYSTKNCLVFFRKYYPRSFGIGALVSLSGKIVKRIKRRQPQNIRAIIRACYEIFVK